MRDIVQKPQCWKTVLSYYDAAKVVGDHKAIRDSLPSRCWLRRVPFSPYSQRAKNPEPSTHPARKLGL